MKVKEESEKAGLKLNIQKIKIMASGPITLWQTEGRKVEAVTDFIFLGFEITVDSDFGYEIKRYLLLGRKAKTYPVSVLKGRQSLSYFADKGLFGQTMVFPVVMYGCESWTIKKAEHRRNDAFRLWCYESPLDCKEIQPVHRKGNQS